MATWVRVRDVETGHEFDVREDVVPATGGVEVIEGYPPNSGPAAVPRPAKHYANKAGALSTPADSAPEPPVGPATVTDTAPAA